MSDETFEQDSIGTQEVPGNPRIIGLGYVMLPPNVDRDKWITNCLSTHTVMIRGEHGDTFRKVFVSKNIIDEIEFPVDEKTKGSPVVWTRLSMLNSIVIVAVFKLQDKASDIYNENLWNKIRKGLNGYANVSINGTEPSVNINVNSKENGKGKIRINLINPDDTATFDLFARGTINLLCTKGFNIGSYESFELYTVDKTLKKIASLSYKSGEGYVIFDEFKNKITLDKHGVKIEDLNSNTITCDSNGVLLTPASTMKINVGGNGEPIPLGNTLNNNLNDLLTQLQTITTALTTFSASQATASAPTPTSGLVAGFTSLGSSLAPVLVKIPQIMSALQNQLSTKSTAK